jgi:hypothetical protein
VRLARRVFITVPHRFFPIEHHTAIPLAHWTKCRLSSRLRASKSNWAREDELILMSSRRLSSLVPAGLPFHVGYTGVRFGPFSSNLYLTIAPERNIITTSEVTAERQSLEPARARTRQEIVSA